MEGSSPAEEIRDDGIALRYVAEGDENHWIPDSVLVSVSRLHVYIPELYPSTTILPLPLDIPIVGVLEAGDSAFSHEGFDNDGEWYRLQTELGSEPDNIPPPLPRPLPEGFTTYEHLDPNFARVVTRPDVFGQWLIRMEAWIGKADDETSLDSSTRNYWYERFQFAPMYWNETYSLYIQQQGSYGIQRFVATLESPYGIFNSPKAEYATRVCFITPWYPLDFNGRPFVWWIMSYLGEPYEWGGYWYGGKADKLAGAHVAYEGYGIDCTGLISCAAQWAGYEWSPWRRSIADLWNVTYGISDGELTAGDLLTGPTSGSPRHVVAVILREEGTELIDTIEAKGTDYREPELIDNVVRILEARRIDDWTDLGYYCRRLQPSTSLPPIHGMQSTSQEVQGR